MIDIFKKTIEELLLYNNGTLLLIFFILAVIALIILEEDKSVKNILIYLSIALTVLFICPLFAYIGNKIDTEIYYRVWWTIPMGLTICYSAIKVIFRFQKLWKRAIALMVAIVIIAVNGSFIYTNALRFEVENKYHLPQMVVDVADYVTQDIPNPTTIMAIELMIYVRQYNSNVQVPFSRYYFKDVELADKELYDALCAEEYDVSVITEAAKRYQALYVVLNSSIPQIGEMEDYGFSYLDFIDGYYIYRYDEMYQDLIDCGLIKNVIP